MREPALDVAHGLLAAHLARQEDIDQNAGLVGLALEQFGDWVASADPDELPGDLITLVAVLAGMTAWFARYFTGDVPDDWDLDLTDQRPPPSSSIGSSSGSAKRACDAGDC